MLNLRRAAAGLAAATAIFACTPAVCADAAASDAHSVELGDLGRHGRVDG